MKRVIIIPTYNEAKNILGLIEKIYKTLSDVNILVVDDNSPDGTGLVVMQYSRKNPKVSLLSRPKKEGLGKAYINAISEVVKDKYVDEIALMDADYSHNPKYLPIMFEMLSKYDVVIGSRYINNGGTIGWETWRKFLSLLANIYCKIILKMKIWDTTSGFYAIKADKIRQLDLSSIDASGYAFQIELKYLLYKKNSRLFEIPIVFENRAGGESKISNHIIYEGVLAPWKMLFKQKDWAK